MFETPRPRMIYLIAGEASGDLLGVHLMRALKAASKEPLQFYGVGGERMQEEGLVSLFPYTDLSILGFIEVLPHAMRVMSRVDLTVEDILAKAPDMVVTIDVPGFSLRVVKRLREEDIPAKFVHYVAPTVWAYKPERALRCAALFDHMLLLLPFEKPYFDAVGLPSTFVGHAVAAETSPGDGQQFRSKHQIAPEQTLIALLPGSRISEVKRHMPIMVQSLALLKHHHPDLAAVCAVSNRVLPYVLPHLKRQSIPFFLALDEKEKKDAIAASNIALAKSGTVTLEVALAHTPMIVIYRVNSISAWALKRIFLGKFVNIINMINGREDIPELLQDDCTPNILASAADAIINSPERMEKQRAAYRQALQLMTPMGQALPSELAAQVVLNMLPPSLS